MGMDVHGIAPTSEVGEYFRNNVWWWRPLWEYCAEVCPEVVDGELYGAGCFNDGAGPDAEGAERLGQALHASVASGHAEAWGAARKAALDAMPDEVCHICEGTGKRLEPPAVGAGSYPCNGCKATGKVRPFDTHYPFNVENVSEFAAFCVASGGFTID